MSQLDCLVCGSPIDRELFRNEVESLVRFLVERKKVHPDVIALRAPRIVFATMVKLCPKCKKRLKKSNLFDQHRTQTGERISAGERYDLFGDGKIR